MVKLYANQLHLIKNYYEPYPHNQPVIFSIFENQFEGYAYVNDIGKLNWAILQTPFFQHFLAGEPTPGCETHLENIIFDIILQEQSEKELVLFTHSDQWHPILQNIFIRNGGTSDVRKLFSFSPANYRNMKRPTCPNNVVPVLEKCKVLPFSRKETLSVKLLLDDEQVTHCSVIMEGKGMAEIDIFTSEAHRGKGYAAYAATLLIDNLLSEGLVPCWSTWPYRVESQHLAKKLGFVPMPDAKGWIWQES